MPQLPTYDAPVARSSALARPSPERIAPLEPGRTPNVRQDSIASPNLFAGATHADAAFGRALENIGDKVAMVAVAMQERENADMVTRAETAMKDSYIKYEQDARKNRQGRFAKEITQDTEKWWADEMAKHSENFGNDTQRRLFRERIAPVRQAALSSMSGFENAQLEKSEIEGLTASKGASINMAIANPTTDNIRLAVITAEGINRRLAAKKGWEPEQLAQEQLKDTTTLHTEVIKQLVRGNPIVAEAYFQRVKGEIDPKLYDDIGKLAEAATVKALGEQTAAAVWGPGPATDGTPIEQDKLEQQIRDRLKDNQPAMDHAIASLRQRVEAAKASRRERAEGQEADVNRLILSGATRAQVESSVEFLRLPPEKARQISAYLENRDYTRAARAAADASRRDAEESRQERRLAHAGFGAYLQYSRPDTLVSMTENQILNLLPSIGRELTGRLMEQRRSLAAKPEKVIEARMDRQDFDQVADEIGLRPFDPTKTEEQRRELGRLLAGVEQRIDSEQRAKKRELTRDEKRDLMRRELDNTVLVDRTFLPDPKKPAVLLSADERKNAYVVLDGGREVRLDSIPEKDRAEIIEGRRKRGLPITEKAIAETFVRTHARKAGPGATARY